MDAMKGVESTPPAPTASTASASVPTIKLWCMLETSSEMFDVDIPVDEFISTLKRRIEAENLNLLEPIDSNPLLLVRVTNTDGTPITSNVLDDNVRQQVADAARAVGTGVVSSITYSVLEPFSTLKNCGLARSTPQGFVNILVVCPQGLGLQTAAPKFTWAPRPSDGVSLGDPLKLSRANLMAKIEKILTNKRVLFVRSPPGSGKTSLRILLEAYLRKSNCQRKIESVSCYRVYGTHDPADAQGCIINQVKHMYPEITDWDTLQMELDYLLLDNAQRLYAYPMFLNALLTIPADRRVRIVLFASFYSQMQSFQILYNGLHS